jgi:hypothetical protein
MYVSCNKLQSSRVNAFVSSHPTLFARRGLFPFFAIFINKQQATNRNTARVPKERRARAERMWHNHTAHRGTYPHTEEVECLHERPHTHTT